MPKHKGANQMNIGITCYPTLGGSGVVATELGKMLAARGHQVHFITSSMPFRLGAFHRNIYYHEVEVNNYSVFQYPPYDLSLASKMAQITQLEHLDILHVHYAVPHAISAYLAKQMVNGKVKVVTTLHGTDITVLGYDENLSNLIRFGIEQSDAVTAVSESLIAETRSLLHINKPIDCIYNFIDHRIFRQQEVKQLRQELIANDEKILLHISNFRKVKRVEDVIHIFHLVNQQMPTKLVMIGEGPEMPHVRKLISDYQLEDQVLFLGKRDDVAEMISVSDCVLLPSEKESFGLVALEAMACGIPVVGSDAGGIPEVVLHGKTGFLAPVGNYVDMANYVLQLLRDEHLWMKFSSNSLTRAYDFFNADRIVDQYEMVYHRLLQS